MALLKSIPTTFGVPATYWHVCAIAWDITAPKTAVQLAGFASAEARQMAGGIPLARANVEIENAQGSEPPRRDEAYAAIKAMPDWADAEDC